MNNKQVLIFGATGNMGGAAARELLRRGWHVRGVTRNPQSEKAQALSALGAEMVQADMDDRATLEAAFAGMERAFTVQNWQAAGVEGEVRQGKLVADVAREAGVKHLVYGSAGIGVPGTGVAHFESKVVVEQYMHQIGLPVTAVRPTPFMELLYKNEFFPALGAWGTLPRIVGWELPFPWVAVEDIGIVIATLFSEPERWIGRDVNNLTGDVKSLQECREIFQRVTGKKPFRVPFPVRLFEKVVSEEMVTMWRWAQTWIEKLGPEALWAQVEVSRQVHPQIQSVEMWLRRAVRQQLEPAAAPALETSR